jgi:hypothetical protein
LSKSLKELDLLEGLGNIKMTQRYGSKAAEWIKMVHVRDQWHILVTTITDTSDPLTEKLTQFFEMCPAFCIWHVKQPTSILQLTHAVVVLWVQGNHFPHNEGILKFYRRPTWSKDKSANSIFRKITENCLPQMNMTCYQFLKATTVSSSNKRQLAFTWFQFRLT